MKKIILFSFVVVLTSFLFACSKGVEKKSLVANKENIMKVGSSNVGTCFSNIAFHREKFRRNDGKICNCVKCFGICKIDPDKGLFNGIIFISSDSSYATIYSLEYQEDDNDFKIDYDIDVEFTVENGGFDGQVKFLAGSYDYVPLQENIVIGNSNYLAYGSVDVDIEIQ